MQAYSIETERLIIRCYEPQDALQLKLAIDESLEELKAWMPWAKNEPQPLENKIERVRIFRGQFDLNIDYTFAIYEKKENKFIGSCGLHTRSDKHTLEIGYWIRTNETHKGYALEASKALTKVGFEIGNKKRIEIHCDPQNIRSKNIPEKIGFTLEAILKNRIGTSDDGLRDDMIWTMFLEDYSNSSLKNFPIKVFNQLNEQIF